MIVSHDNKYIFYLVPKTGSTTIRNLLRPLGTNVAVHIHDTPSPAYLALTGYAFWRDPVERFVSTYNFLRTYRTVLFKLFPEDFSGVVMPEPLDEESFNALPQHLREKINRQPVDLLERINRTNILGFKPQSAWFDHPNMNVLNYHDFESEARRLIGIFGGDTAIDIPVENEKPNFITDLVVTDDLRRGIEDLYRLDYRYDPC